jgi:endonuclease/exonuclease/phosphatase family metal-dependent hydrolase
MGMRALVADAAHGTVRMATLNVWGVRGDWDERRRTVLREGFTALRPDLITLQETVVTGGYDQVGEILDGYQVVHGHARESDGQGVSVASRWPVGEVVELDQRTSDAFAATTVIVEVLAPDGRIWLANHFPDYQLDRAAQREAQALEAARTIEDLLADRPGHVIVTGDLDADPDATSIRFWTGRHALEGTSVCYRDAWESAHGREPGGTFVPGNRYSVNPDWPYRRIDHVLVRCTGTGGPTLLVDSCRRIFDGPDTASDHYGLLTDLSPTPAVG